MTKDTQPAALSAICKLMNDYRISVPTLRSHLAKLRDEASKQRRGLPPRAVEVLAHIEKHRDDGLTVTAIADLMSLESGGDSAVHQYIRLLNKAGRAYSAQEPGKASKRWFVSEALAQAWLQANQPPTNWISPGAQVALQHIAGSANGLTIDELCSKLDQPAVSAHMYLTALRKAGKIAFCRIPGTSVKRWFSDSDKAASWWKSHQLPARSVLAKKAGPAALTTYTAGSSKTAPKLPDGPVDYSKATRTIDDKVRPTARWQMQESAPLVGGFSSTPPGMNPATGKAWGEAA